MKIPSSLALISLALISFSQQAACKPGGPSKPAATDLRLFYSHHREGSVAPCG